MNRIGLDCYARPPGGWTPGEDDTSPLGLAAKQESVGLDDGVDGPGTPCVPCWGADPRSASHAPERAPDPDWLRVALHEEHVREGQMKPNPRILEYFDATWQKHTSDKQEANAWCAAFVTWSLTQSGVPNHKAVGARSYETYGDPSEPFRGAVAVIQHGRQKHVAFIAGKDKEGNLVLFGGNQNNEVNARAFPRDGGYQLLAVRKPAGYIVPEALKELPVLDAPKAGKTR